VREKLRAHDEREREESGSENSFNGATINYKLQISSIATTPLKNSIYLNKKWAC
jgi:hypothetical protein